MNYRAFLMGVASAAAVMWSSSASAYVCTGTCGALGADGVVTLSPLNHSLYQYISTVGGLAGVGQIGGVGGTNGSQMVSSTFKAQAGDPLTFYFNYITSDGAQYADYAWAELLDAANTHVAWLFTARTEPTGDTSPGLGLPSNDSTLSPATTPIVSGGPNWSPLGSTSGQCYGPGCGYTGWIKSTYAIPTAGSYYVAYGVSNWIDTIWSSGLAIDGLAIADHEIDAPEPLTLSLFGMGLAGLCALRRRKKKA